MVLAPSCLLKVASKLRSVTNGYVIVI